MPLTAHRHDPEARPSWFRTLTGLPLLAYRLVRWRALRGGWLLDFLRTARRFDRRALPAGRPVDVIVLVSDHYEPARRFGAAAAVESVRSWCAAYEELAGPHRDADGRVPQHTWFYRYDYPNPGCVRALSECCFRGFGEVEFHLHHGPDTHETFTATLEAGVEWFGTFGAMLSAEPRPRRRFVYVAGNYALDNGAGDDRLSGCPTELRALPDAGCYADFTFPSLGSHAQPRLANAIYYAAEDGGPKSYDTGVPVEVGRPPSGDLMIFEGPMAIDWAGGRVDDGALENTSLPHPARLAGWLSAHVHVRGRPEWVFVKLSTHAMQSRASFLSPALGEVFSAMEAWWNRPPFRLHYVTAREAYNIVKAAEAGHSGDPNDYRDFEVGRPANRVIACSSPWRLLSYSPERVHLRVLEPGEVRLEFAEGELLSLQGHVREVEARLEGGRLKALRVEGEGAVEVLRRDGPPALVPAGTWWRPGGPALRPCGVGCSGVSGVSGVDDMVGGPEGYRRLR
jgi:hypothetical protein